MRDYSRLVLTPSEVQPECLSRATTCRALQDQGAQVLSYSLSINLSLLVAMYGCAKLIESCGVRRLLFFGRPHQKTYQCLHITACQMLCTRTHHSDSVAMLLKKRTQVQKAIIISRDGRSKKSIETRVAGITDASLHIFHRNPVI